MTADGTDVPGGNVGGGEVDAGACPECGAALRVGATFCASCGARAAAPGGPRDLPHLVPTAPMIAIDLDTGQREPAISVRPSAATAEAVQRLPPVPPLEPPQDTDATDDPDDPGRRRRVVVLAAGVFTLVLVIAAVVAARGDGGGEASTDLAAVALAAPEGLEVAVDEESCDTFANCELVFSATDRSDGETGHIAVIEPVAAESFELPGPSKPGTGRTVRVRSGIIAANAPFCAQLFAAAGDERSDAAPPACRLVTRNLEVIEVGDDLVLWSDLQKNDCVALLPGDSIANAVWFRAVECVGSDGEVMLRIDDFNGVDSPSCQSSASGSGRTQVATFKPRTEDDADVFLCIVHD